MRIVKYTICILLAIGLLTPLTIFAKAGEGLALTIDAKAAVIMEASSGEIIFAQNADNRLAPASVTKVMTMLLVYEALAQGRIAPDDMVTVSEHAASMGGSQVYLEPGESQTVEDLLKAVVIASANDGAVALAEFVSGSEESFVDLMNKRARDLEMTDTAFKNACGLDEEGHFTSAKDIALMSRELITKYPEYEKFATTWMDSITHKTSRGEEPFGLTNTNKLVKWYNGATGLKTGSTGEALYCLSATAKRNDMELIAVVLGAPTAPIRFQEAMKMLDYGYANYKVVKGELPGTVVGTIPVTKGKVGEVAVMVQELISDVTQKGSNVELTANVVINEGIMAPVEEGTVVGSIVYSYEDVEIGQSPLITEEAVEKAGFVDMCGRVLRIWFA